MQGTAATGIGHVEAKPWALSRLVRVDHYAVEQPHKSLGGSLAVKERDSKSSYSPHRATAFAMNSVLKSEKGNLPEYDGVRERNSSGDRKGSVVDATALQAEIFDERYEKTQRGTSSQALSRSVL